MFRCFKYAERWPTNVSIKRKYYIEGKNTLVLNMGLIDKEDTNTN